MPLPFFVAVLGFKKAARLRAAERLLCRRLSFLSLHPLQDLVWADSVSARRSQLGRTSHRRDYAMWRAVTCFAIGVRLPLELHPGQIGGCRLVSALYGRRRSRHSVRGVEIRRFARTSI